jgi:hypothetical protein
MTVRNVATIVSLTLLAFVSGCTNFFEVPIETPLSPKMDVTAFRPRARRRVHRGGNANDVDAPTRDGAAAAQPAAIEVRRSA